MKPRSARTKPKPKRKPASPDLTGGHKRDTRFQPGNSAGDATQFKPGQSGNPAGRPLGARSKLTEAFIAAVAAEFDRRGVDCVRQLDARDFLYLAASLVPKKLDATFDRSSAVPIINLIGRPEPGEPRKP
jgi:hypothetical protein